MWNWGWYQTKQNFFAFISSLVGWQTLCRVCRKWYLSLSLIETSEATENIYNSLLFCTQSEQNASDIIILWENVNIICSRSGYPIYRSFIRNCVETVLIPNDDSIFELKPRSYYRKGWTSYIFVSRSDLFTIGKIKVRNRTETSVSKARNNSKEVDCIFGDKICGIGWLLHKRRIYCWY